MTSAQITTEILEHGHNIQTGEEFIECKDYPSYYVSNKGRFWSHKKHIFLKQRLDGYFRNGKRNGYYFVRLKNKVGKWCNVRVHRQVGLHFIPNLNHLKTLDHIDNIKEHNDSNNLQWMSLADNIKKRHCKPIKVIDLDSGITTKYNSIGEAKINLSISDHYFRKLIRDKTSNCDYHYEIQYA